MAIFVLILGAAGGGAIGWIAWRDTQSLLSAAIAFLGWNLMVALRAGGIVLNGLWPADSIDDGETHPGATAQIKYSIDEALVDRLRWASRVWWMLTIVCIVTGFALTYLKQANPAWACWRGGAGWAKLVGLSLVVLPLLALGAGFAHASHVDLGSLHASSTGRSDLDAIARWQRKQLLIGSIQCVVAISVWIWLLDPAFAMMGW